MKKIFYKENPLDLFPDSCCRVIKKSESHYFDEKQNVVFTGWFSYDWCEGTPLYQFTGLIDGQLVSQWLHEDEFIIVFRSKDLSLN